VAGVSKNCWLTADPLTAALNAESSSLGCNSSEVLDGGMRGREMKYMRVRLTSTSE
jgi:hypothetical protein